MKQGLNLPPALTIIMQSLMALVFGVLGLLVAVPLLAAIVIATQIPRGSDRGRCRSDPGDRGVSAPPAAHRN